MFLYYCQADGTEALKKLLKIPEKKTNNVMINNQRNTGTNQAISVEDLFAVSSVALCTLM